MSHLEKEEFVRTAIGDLLVTKFDSAHFSKEDADRCIYAMKNGLPMKDIKP